MASVGERLRHERELRNRTIDELAEASRVDRRYLDALERGDIEDLPGPAFGKLYIRAYAEHLGFDPQPLIEEYDREQRGPPEPREESAGPKRPVETAVARWREAKIAERLGTAGPEPEPPAEAEADQVEPGPVGPFPEEPRPARRGYGAPAAVIGSIVILAAVAWALLPSRSEPPIEAPSPTSRPVEARPAPTPTPEPSRAPAVPASRLSIIESAVGHRVVDRRIQGRSERFAPGEAAWYLTQVVGGRAGDSIRHVWMLESRAVYSVELPLGGPHWRTWSRATLGSTGRWAVEARDADGRVLARSEFVVD